MTRILTRFTLAILLIFGTFTKIVLAQDGNASQSEATTTLLASPDQGLQFCFGRGGICSVAMDMNSACDIERKAHGTDAEASCKCTAGVVAVSDS